MKKVELLAPAGNMECLKAAILAGCDAVYLGGKLFGARSFAGNFTNEEIVKAINYAHLYGVKVYVTINTIIYENEVERFLDFIRFVHKNNVDAVIVQDLGMLDLITKKFPNLEVHASTQMHVHNLSGALFAKEMNVRRVVLARETSLDEIKRIKKEAMLEIEAFVHGALCVSYSGQCLMSALIGNRSGNRGTCAQACRKKYDLYSVDGKKLSKDKYLLSTKDLCTINNVGDLINAGVDSLKIEGRMKRKEYVYLVTKLYRMAIDAYYENKTLNTKEAILELKKIFNREFTKGFIFNEENNQMVNQKRPNHVGIEVGKVTYSDGKSIKIRLKHDLSLNDGLRIIDDKKQVDYGLVVQRMDDNGKEVKIAPANHVVELPYDKRVNINSRVVMTTDSRQIKRINDELSMLKRKVLIDIKVVVKKNKGLSIFASDGKTKVSYESLIKPEKALTFPTVKDVIKRQITKLGNSVYQARSVEVILDDDVFINVKDLNDLRRKMVLMLDEQRVYNSSFVEKEYFCNLKSFPVKKETSVLLNTKKEYDQLKDKYDVIYTANDELIGLDKVIYKFPRVVKDYPKVYGKTLIAEVGGLFKRNNFDTDFSFNVSNSYAVAFLHEKGANRVTICHELNKKQIKCLVDAYHKRYNKHPNLEVIAKGYPEAMISKFNLNKMYNVEESYLKDEYGNKFKVVSNNDFMTIYNYKKIPKISDKEYYELGINNVRTNL